MQHRLVKSENFAVCLERRNAGILTGDLKSFQGFLVIIIIVVVPSRDYHVADRLEVGVVEAWTKCLAAKEASRRAGGLGIPSGTAKIGRIKEMLATIGRTLRAAHERHVLGRILVDTCIDGGLRSDVSSSNLGNTEGGGCEQCHTNDGLATHIED